MAITINGSTGISGVPAGGYNLVDGDMPSGAVLQVVHATVTSEISTTSTSWTASGLSLSITPSSASSKIFVSVSGFGGGTGGSGYWPGYGIFRDSTELTATAIMKNSATIVMDVPLSLSYLDSPATTSATTYQVYIRSEGGSQTARIGTGSFVGGEAHITAMEIAG